ncbi:DUF1963 domain-containing protein [Streptomyces sp. NPDC005876]|uniref:DUF1963 domain-containing protein n=1 Tax=Streptomyces sp. NPDC005876 TaxID=3157076 RepID=UPI0033F633B7
MVDDWNEWNAERVRRFRGEAGARGLPEGEVEAWVRALVPGTFFAEGGDGPVVVRLGGSPGLPEGVPVPECPLVAAVDCALLPGGSGLPADGRLLFFGEPSLDFRGPAGGSVVHVPAGAATDVRKAGSVYGPFAEQELRTVWRHLSPLDGESYAESRWEEPDDEQYELGGELGDAWRAVGGSWPVWTFALGGQPVVLNDNPLAAPEDGGDWTVLAAWRREEAVVTWLIRREDLAVGRFDRVYGYADM